MSGAVVIRPVVEEDLPILFEHQIDPEATRMADFPARDRETFFAHWSKVLAEPTNVVRTILHDGVVVGHIGSWDASGERLVGYWIGREHWGRGIATRALAQLLAILPQRPLLAHVAAHNAGSIRVLEKNGFVKTAEGPDGWIMTLGA